VNAALQHLIVVDDEAGIRNLLANYFSRHGFRVSAVASGAGLIHLMQTDPAVLVLLDLGLPAEDGFEFARRLRERWRCGLVFVTGRGDTVDRIVGLEIGADDYVTKPFDLRELLARVKSVLRRLQPEAPEAAIGPAPERSRLRFDGWTLDAGARRLTAPTGADVPITTGEFDLLHLLVRHAGRVLSRDFLLEQTRRRQASPFDRTIDVQVGRLRRKLEADPQAPQLIKSVRGVGYLFVPQVDEET
jgi:two-component system, OmpR family, response regulator